MFSLTSLIPHIWSAYEFVSNSQQIVPLFPRWTMKTNTNNRSEWSPGVSFDICCPRIDLTVKNQLQWICHLRDYHHMSSVDKVLQQFVVFSRHMIMWCTAFIHDTVVGGNYSFERKWVTFFNFGVDICGPRLDKALVYMIVIFPYTVQRLRLCLKFDKVAR